MIKKLVIRNIFSISIGQGVSAVLNFISVAMAARFIGVDGFGEFSTLLALVTIISKFVDFGIGPIAFRETSKEPENYSFLNNALSIRLFLFVLINVISNLILVFVINYSAEKIILFNLLYLNIIFSSKFLNFRDILELPFKVRLKMSLPVFCNVLDNFLLLVLVIIMGFKGGGLKFFIFSYFFSNLPGFLILLILLKLKYNYFFSFSTDKIIWFIKEAMPVFGFALLTILFQQVDLLLIKYFINNYDAGIYSASARLTMPLNIIAVALSQTAIPLVIRALKSNEEQNQRLQKIIYKLFYLFPFLLAVIFTFKTKEIITLIFGIDYINSSFSTMILAWTQIFIFHSFFSIDLLTVYNFQKYSFYFALIQLLINTSANLLVIPAYSFNGAAVVKLFSCAVSFMFLIIIMRTKGLIIYPFSLKLFAWSFVMIVFCFLFSFMNIYIYFVLCLFSLPFSLLFFRFFDNNELRQVLSIFKLENYSDNIILFQNKILSLLKIKS